MNNIIETERLYLRCFDEKDIGALFPILSDKEVMRYSMTGPMSLAQVDHYVKNCIKSHTDNGFSPYALICQNTLIGYAGLDKRLVDNVEKVQLTFRLGCLHWGKGMATEIGKAILQYSFGALGLKEIIAIVDPDNHASIKLIEKLGMRFDKAVLYEGLALHVYSITA